jgi:hypothetical protein
MHGMPTHGYFGKLYLLICFCCSQVIWFGDLNYRLNLSDSDVRFLLAREELTILLANDQVK